MLNQTYLKSVQSASVVFEGQESERNESFYQYYRPEILAAHKKFYSQVPLAQACSLWAEFSLKKIKLFPGETLTDLLLANAIVLALEYCHKTFDSNEYLLQLKIFEYYKQLATKKVSLASPFFNGLRRKGQRNLSSCFIMEVEDSLESIMKHVTYCARISKASGGAGVFLGKIRGKGATIAGNKNAASSVLAWVRLFDQVCVSVNQLGHRPGAITVALPIWHIDVEDFLDCQTENGDLRAKAYNIQPQICIDNEFMHAVLDGSKYALYCPKDLADSGIDPSKDPEWHTRANKLDLVKKEINARKLWALIQERQLTVGRPYIFFTENAQVNTPFKNFGNINSANLCVSGETKLLTKNGNLPIKELAGKSIEVWNGSEWSLSPVFKTGENRQLYRVTLSNGRHVDCTDEHKWFIKNDYRKPEQKVPTKALVPGDKLPAIEYPLIVGNAVISYPYTQGFVAGDGNINKNRKAFDISLYGPKIALASELEGHLAKTLEENIYNSDVDRQRFYVSKEVNATKFFVPVGDYSLDTKLKWLAGYLDADGTMATDCNNVKSIQISCVNKEFLLKVTDLLNELSCVCSFRLEAEAKKHLLPDSKRNLKLYDCQAVYRLCINSHSLKTLLELGLKCYRLDTAGNSPKHKTKSHAVTVISIEPLEGVHDTYCLTEPKYNKVVFNGVVTSNCVESFSYFETERYIHCCNLISINLAEHDDFHTISESSKIATEMADLSLDLSHINIPEATAHVKDFRTIGVGMMGLADWLAKNNTYYSDLAFIEKTQKTITLSVYEASVNLSGKWGHCKASNLLESEFWEQLNKELGFKTGTKPRNAMLIATAPNTSTSLVMGATASFLPPYSTEFVDESENHSLEVCTKYLPELYIQNASMNQSFITDATAVLQKWTDSGVSMEYLLPKGASWSSNEAFSKNKIAAWKQGVKTIYYIRTTAPEEKPSCSMCAN